MLLILASCIIAAPLCAIAYFLRPKAATTPAAPTARARGLGGGR